MHTQSESTETVCWDDFPRWVVSWRRTTPKCQVMLQHSQKIPLTLCVETTDKQIAPQPLRHGFPMTRYVFNSHYKMPHIKASISLPLKKWISSPFCCSLWMCVCVSVCVAQAGLLLLKDGYGWLIAWRILQSRRQDDVIVLTTAPQWQTSTLSAPTLPKPQPPHCRSPRMTPVCHRLDFKYPTPFSTRQGGWGRGREAVSCESPFLGLLPFLILNYSIV